jgi:hypothetical protein
MKRLINLSILIVLALLAHRIYQTDCIDRTNPFGTDKVKNSQYADGQSGEDYGVGTFWGKPSKSDKLSDHLDKIQFLTNSSFRDIFWRRAIVAGIVGGVSLIFLIDKNIFLEEPVKLMFAVILVFVLIYFSNMYYIHHVLLRRKKFIDTHVRKIKRTLKLSLGNKIDDNDIL